VAVAVARRPETAIRPGYTGFLTFAEVIDLPLRPYMRRISRAYFSRAREVVAAIGLHHLVTTRGASGVVGAASRDQARVCFERMEGFVDAGDLDITVRHLELRYEGPEGIRRLRVVPSDGPRAHGLSCSLYLADEVWAWAERADLLTAMQTGLVKRPDSKLLAITTSSGDLDSPLGRWRRRAMAQNDVHRAGPVVESKSKDLHWLEWSLGEQHDASNLRAVKRVNPAPQIGVRDLRRQRESLTEAAFLQFHCCRWGIRESAWLPPGAWAGCRGAVEFKPGENVWLGVDVGGSRSATSVVWLNERLHVGCAVFEGEDGIFEANEQVMRLAEKFTVMEVNFDPWRAGALARGWELRGLKTTSFPWTDARVIPGASELYDAIVECRIVHSGDPALDRHMAAVVAKSTRRGIRIDKANESDNIDAACALLMGFEAATAPAPEPTRILGWL
jgi:phage terminase large subunit-like protein